MIQLHEQHTIDGTCLNSATVNFCVVIECHFIFKAGLSCKVNTVKEMVYNVQNFAIFSNTFIILKHPR